MMTKARIAASSTATKTITFSVLPLLLPSFCIAATPASRSKFHIQTLQMYQNVEATNNFGKLKMTGLTELIALIKFTSKQSNHCKAFSNIHSPFYTYSQNQGIGNRADANGNIIKNCWNVQNLDNGIIFALESRRRQ